MSATNGCLRLRRLCTYLRARLGISDSKTAFGNDSPSGTVRPSSGWSAQKNADARSVDEALVIVFLRRLIGERSISRQSIRPGFNRTRSSNFACQTGMVVPAVEWFA